MTAMPIAKLDRHSCSSQSSPRHGGLSVEVWQLLCWAKAHCFSKHKYRSFFFVQACTQDNAQMPEVSYVKIHCAIGREARKRSEASILMPTNQESCQRTLQTCELLVWGERQGLLVRSLLFLNRQVLSMTPDLLVWRVLPLPGLSSISTPCWDGKLPSGAAMKVILVLCR